MYFRVCDRSSLLTMAAIQCWVMSNRQTDVSRLLLFNPCADLSSQFYSWWMTPSRKDRLEKNHSGSSQQDGPQHRNQSRSGRRSRSHRSEAYVLLYQDVSWLSLTRFLFLRSKAAPPDSGNTLLKVCCIYLPFTWVLSPFLLCSLPLVFPSSLVPISLPTSRLFRYMSRINCNSPFYRLILPSLLDPRGWPCHQRCRYCVASCLCPCAESGTKWETNNAEWTVGAWYGDVNQKVRPVLDRWRWPIRGWGSATQTMPPWEELPVPKCQPWRCTSTHPRKSAWVWSLIIFSVYGIYNALIFLPLSIDVYVEGHQLLGLSQIRVKWMVQFCLLHFYLEVTVTMNMPSQSHQQGQGQDV